MVGTAAGRVRLPASRGSFTTITITRPMHSCGLRPEDSRADCGRETFKDVSLSSSISEAASLTPGDGVGFSTRHMKQSSSRLGEPCAMSATLWHYDSAPGRSMVRTCMHSCMQLKLLHVEDSRISTSVGEDPVWALAVAPCCRALVAGKVERIGVFSLEGFFHHPSLIFLRDEEVVRRRRRAATSPSLGLKLSSNLECQTEARAVCAAEARRDP